MKQTIWVLALFVGCAPAPQTSNTPAGGSAMPSSIIDPYLKIQAALASDSIDNLRANAGDIATAATSLGSPAMRIDTAALQLASATEIADARSKFATLSQAVVTYMDGLHLLPPDGVRVATCPEQQQSWLQEGSAIANPYTGSSTPACGSFR